MNQTEILDRIVDIIEQYPMPLPEKVKSEWEQLKTDLRDAQDEPCYGFGFWHRGYEIELYGSKLLYCQVSREQYEDMLEMFGGKISIDDFKKKWDNEIQSRTDNCGNAVEARPATASDNS